jgi:hypothetical protein
VNKVSKVLLETQAQLALGETLVLKEILETQALSAQLEPQERMALTVSMVPRVLLVR